jgi:hypothetical protein
MAQLLRVVRRVVPFQGTVRAMLEIGTAASLEIDEVAVFFERMSADLIALSVRPLFYEGRPVRPAVNSAQNRQAIRKTIEPKRLESHSSLKALFSPAASLSQHARQGPSTGS